jgi:hypothetical protein
VIGQPGTKSRLIAIFKDANGRSMRTAFSLTPLVFSGLICALFAPGQAAAAADQDVEQLKVRVAQLEAEVKLLKERLSQMEGQAKQPAANPFKMTVLPGDWDNAGTQDIEAVCRSVFNEFSSLFPERRFDPITIRYDGKQGPMVVFGKGPDGERRVLLYVKDTHWAQFAFQFAHEWRHIACNYREINRANLWFEESICETASLFALRRMAETWKTKPPYSNWKSYAPSLREYADNRLKETEKLDDLTFLQWYQRNEAELRKTGVNRQKNQVVAAALLPLFEKDPTHWQAVGFLNQWDAKKELSFPEFLEDWHDRVPKEHKAFVAEAAGLFGVKVK